MNRIKWATLGGACGFLVGLGVWLLAILVRVVTPDPKEGLDWVYIMALAPILVIGLALIGCGLGYYISEERDRLGNDQKDENF